MNFRAFFAPLLLLTVFIAFACNKNSDYIDSDIYTAEIKSTVTCANYYACIVTKGNIDLDLVDNTWRYDKNIYQKAFRVLNHCAFPKNLGPGSSFRFKILQNPTRTSCMVCAIGILNPPSKSLNIEVVP